MNKDQKAAQVDEIAAQINESEAVLAVDYRGISVPQVAELRAKLTEAGARFRVVKNTLTERAADKAGADELKELLEGPTAFTFVAPEGDVAMAAKALAQFRREHEILEPKGGRMGGEPLTIDQIVALSRLPARDILHGQLVGVIASPITGLVRGLNQMIAGFAQQLQQIVDQGLVGGEAEAPPEDEAPAEEKAEAPEEASQEADQEAQAEDAAEEAEESAGEGEGGEPSTEGEAPQDEGEAEEAAPEAAEETEEAETEAPSEGDEEEKEGE